MNIKHIALAAAVSAAILAPQKSEAGKKELYGAVGFLSGVLLANAVTPSYSETAYYDNSYRSSGRWEYQTHREWVPGYWSWEYRHCGTRVRVWNPGRYETYSSRQWVDDCRPYRTTRHYR